MHLTIVTPPSPGFFDAWLNDAKVYLGRDGDIHDALIVDLIRTATARLDGPAGDLGRALAPQTWRGRFDESEGEVHIPLGPVTAVGSIAFTNPNGEPETMPGGDYIVEGDFIRPRVRWPSSHRTVPGIFVTFTAGYPDLASVPAPVKTGVMEYVAALYDNRGGLQTIPPIASDLLDQYRARAF